MAHYQEVDYSEEEVKSSVAGGRGGLFGRRHHGGHGGVQEHVVVKEKFEEIDGVSRAGGRHGHFEARESKFEEDVNTRTGELHERKENFVVKAEN